MKDQAVLQTAGTDRTREVPGLASLPPFSECCPTTRHLHTECRVCNRLVWLYSLHALRRNLSSILISKLVSIKSKLIGLLVALFLAAVV